jgi:hypothetical protein
MKTTKTLLAIYASGIPGGLGDMKRLNPPRGGGIGGLMSLLKPKEDDLRDEAFFNDSTTVMFGMIVRAIAQIANNDPIGRFTAGNIPDSIMVMGIRGGPAAALVCKGHSFTATFDVPKQYHAKMEFDDIHVARDLFDGKVNALACLGRSQIHMSGNVSLIDNLNRLLDRVAIYLA